MKASSFRIGLASTLWYVVAFNFSFFVQELFLVVPKALTPGLSPTLYHNDHGWTGDHPMVELLQGTGVIGTLLLGLIAYSLLTRRDWTVGGRIAMAWIAYHGVFMALPQFMLGAFVPANDVGRAMTWLALPEAGRIAVAVAAFAAALVFARLLAPEFARAGRLLVVVAVPAILGSLSVLPYRVPRELLEVMIVPAMVMLAGVPWLLIFGRGLAVRATPGAPSLVRPALLAIALLLFFHLVLRPGIAF